MQHIYSLSYYFSTYSPSTLTPLFRLGTFHNNDEVKLAVSKRLQIKSSIPATTEFLNSSRDGKMRELS
jgi:hypothetical protein